ncbi:hypothetical protein MAR_032464 [Mya arenaria]|uniref:Uncharacterized protein n=1 Tax=Mya arenaria TaxID=6604 RepID=A0ABY7F6Q0_MYAAR|nr:hypothetical protein MAR_032464 [Mya arenaria]
MSENQKEMANLQKVISGKVIKKYRMRSYLENRSMVERRKVVKNSTERKRMLRSKAEKIKGDVENFLNRDDNSRVMPVCFRVGLQDFEGIFLQTTAKRSNISKLHIKKCVCLCARHQNMGFKLKSLKNMNVCSCTSPDGFVEMYKSVPVQFESMKEKITQEHIKFQQWKRVKLPNGKERMRIFLTTMHQWYRQSLQNQLKLLKKLAMIHFWTDSPSSQYRNRSIFDLLSNFESRHGCRATWHYFESGHGKSACDGVGGMAKRNADMPVKQSKAVIQDAHDFFAWTISAQNEIEYQLITPEEYQTCHEEVEKRKTLIKPLKGTMSLHAIATGKEGILYVRNTTCACDLCFSDGGFNGKSNCKWEAVTMKKVATQNKVSRLGTTPINAEPEQDNRGKENEESSELVLEVSDFVVAKYDGICYIGQILEIDPADESYHVNFMAASGKSVTRFKWPSQADQLWLEREDILRTIDPQVATGKGGRMFTVPEEVISFIEL